MYSVLFLSQLGYLASSLSRYCRGVQDLNAAPVKQHSRSRLTACISRVLSQVKWQRCHNDEQRRVKVTTALRTAAGGITDTLLRHRTYLALASRYPSPCPPK